MVKNIFWRRVAIIIGVILLYLGLVYILYAVESGNKDSNIKSYTDALWYSVITLTTIGYGDRFPVSGLGRIISLVFVLGSVGVLGYLISEISNKIFEFMENKKLGYQGTDFENHVVIVNWNEFAQEILQEIVNAGKQVVMITKERDDIEIIYNNYNRELVFALHCDYMDEKTFKRANLGTANTVLLNFEDDTENLVNLIALRKIHPTTSYVIALNSPSLKETFHELGVTFTLSKNEVASKMIASFVFEPVVAQITEGLMSSVVHEDDMGLMQFRVIETNPYIGAKCFDLFITLKKDLNVILVGLSKHNGNLINSPTNDHTVEIGDYLAVMGCSNARKKLTELFQVEEGI
jgi:voltage-gated potassium channel